MPPDHVTFWQIVVGSWRQILPTQLNSNDRYHLYLYTQSAPPQSGHFNQSAFVPLSATAALIDVSSGSRVGRKREGPFIAREKKLNRIIEDYRYGKIVGFYPRSGLITNARDKH